MKRLPDLCLKNPSSALVFLTVLNLACVGLSSVPGQPLDRTTGIVSLLAVAIAWCLAAIERARIQLLRETP